MNSYVFMRKDAPLKDISISLQKKAVEGNSAAKETVGSER
jgi:hypothetical protein